MVDLPFASLEENRHIVKPILALGLTMGFVEEALTGHGMVVSTLYCEMQNQCRSREQ
jgi:hypothetical protein